jgi:autophagy-related protein 9
MIIGYIVVFSVYSIVSVHAFVRSIRSALEAKYVFEENLGISSRKLQGGAVEWHEVVESLSILQSSGEYRIAISDELIDPLIVAQRIMRRENFMIALFNVGVLDFTLPLSTFFQMNMRPFYSKTLEVKFSCLSFFTVYNQCGYLFVNIFFSM